MAPMLHLSFAALLLSTMPVPAEGLLDRINRGDAIISIRQADADMASAIKHARATLPEFLALARAPKPSTSAFALKIGLKDGDGHEFVWIRPFEQKGRNYSGQLRNEPRSNKNLKFGDTISFSEKDIADWAYTDDGRMKGNFTTCALLKQQPKRDSDAFKRKYGLECDF